MLLIVLLLAVTAACSDGRRELSRAWVDRHVDQLTQTWGEASEERAEEDGLVLVYISYWQDGFSQAHRCEHRFSIDMREIVRAHSMSNCTPSPYRWPRAASKVR